MSDDDSFGEVFGQRHPPLSIYIKGILERYPDGQIFKVRYILNHNSYSLAVVTSTVIARVLVDLMNLLKTKHLNWQGYTLGLYELQLVNYDEFVT